MIPGLKGQILEFPEDVVPLTDEEAEAYLADTVPVGFPDFEEIGQIVQDTHRNNFSVSEGDYKRVERLRLALHDTRDLYIDTSWDGAAGIGDSVMSLRYAIYIARVFPNKAIKLEMNRALQQISIWDLPENIQIVQNEPDKSFNGFRLNLEYIVPNMPLRRTKRLPSTYTFRVSSFDFQLSEYKNREWREFYRSDKPSNKFPTEIDNLSHCDLQMAFMFAELGIPFDPELIHKPIMRIPEEFVSEKGKYDFVILPDAKEGSIENGFRSAKSLSLEEWQRIFAQLPRTLKISIVRGVSHPDYTNQVFRIAEDYFDSVEYAETETLDDVVKLMCQAKKIVGKDSGTSHIAQHVVQALQKMGVRSTFINLFINIYGPAVRYGTTFGHILRVVNHPNTDTTKLIRKIMMES